MVTGACGAAIQPAVPHVELEPEPELESVTIQHPVQEELPVLAQLQNNQTVPATHPAQLVSILG